jgi:hypothetical protein
MRWSPPPVGHIKLNWDAAIDRRNKLMRIGLIAWDHASRVRVFACSFHPYISDPPTAESFAARHRASLSLREMHKR